jgi:hypothetical protein
MPASQNSRLQVFLFCPFISISKICANRSTLSSGRLSSMQSWIKNLSLHKHFPEILTFFCSESTGN